MVLSTLYNHLFPFLMINARITGLLIMAPVFGHSAIPIRVKTAMIILFSLLMYFGLGVGFNSPEITVQMAIIGILVEFATGAAMGVVLTVFFSAVGYAAGIIAPQMGMAISQLVDPSTQQMQPLISTFFSLIAVTFFLVIDGHHMLLEGLYHSYRLVPLGSFSINAAFTEELTNIGSELFIIAFKLASPVLAIIIFMNIGMAIMARAVPQVNVLVVGFIVTISVGMFVLSVFFPVFNTFFEELMEDAVTRMMWLLKTV